MANTPAPVAPDDLPSLNTGEYIYPRRIRAFAKVWIRNDDVTDRYKARLIKIRVIDKEVSTDEAHIELDDRVQDGQYFRIPQDGEPVRIGLGWQDSAVYTLFEGVVSDVESFGQKKAGRRLEITATSVSFLTKSKQPIRQTFEGEGGQEISLGDAIRKFGGMAGLDVQNIDPKFDKIKAPHWVATGESFLNWLTRHAGAYGGIPKFANQGGKTIVSLTDVNSDKNALGQQMPTIDIVFGDWGKVANLIAWRIKPIAGRPQWKETAGQWFDATKGTWDMAINKIAAATGGWFGGADNRYTSPNPAQSEGQAQNQAESDGSTSQKRRGTGWAVIDGDAHAMAGAKADVKGVRPGVDGKYKITEAEHTYTKNGGWTVRLELEQPMLSGQASQTFEQPATAGGGSGGGTQ